MLDQSATEIPEAWFQHPELPEGKNLGIQLLWPEESVSSVSVGVCARPPRRRPLDLKTYS